MAKEDHLLEFHIENFKRFRSLSIKGLRQFNLVIGDNNIGKTSLLESLLYSDDDERFSKNLLAALNFKNLGGEYREGHLSFFANRHSFVQSPNSEIRLKFSYRTSKTNKERNSERMNFLDGAIYKFDKYFHLSKYQIDMGDGKLFGQSTLRSYHRSEELEHGYFCPLIPFSQSYGKDLSDIYSRNVLRNRQVKKKLKGLLSVLIPNIEDLEFDTAMSNYSVLVVALRGEDSVVPLANFGDGALKLFRILLYLVLFSGQRLMIDEIDTGIHYSRMKDFWKTILLAAEENEVQLFVTTHNLECIRYFKEALEESELEHLQKEARTITLVENPKTRDVEAVTSEFFELEHAIEVGNEIR